MIYRALLSWHFSATMLVVCWDLVARPWRPLNRRPAASLWFVGLVLLTRALRWAMAIVINPIRLRHSSVANPCEEPTFAATTMTSCTCKSSVKTRPTGRRFALILLLRWSCPCCLLQWWVSLWAVFVLYSLIFQDDVNDFLKQKQLLELSMLRGTLKVPKRFFISRANTAGPNQLFHGDQSQLSSMQHSVRMMAQPQSVGGL